MLRRTFLGAAAVLALTGAASAQETVKIGLILPMTGPFASTGRQIEAAAKLYMQQKGDTVAGKKIQLIVKDDTGTADVTKRLAQELIVNDKIAVMAGLRPDPSGSRSGAARHAGESAGRGHGGSHCNDHRGVALHRPHQLHTAAGHGADGGLGGTERHQEGRDPRVRLRTGHRCREGFHQRFHGEGRAGGKPAGAARRIPISRPSSRRSPMPSPTPCSCSCLPASAPSS